jgi:23S rRNA pseudouridine2605 synthase
LFTNDGELARSVLDPESCLQKTYVVRCSGSLDDDDLARLCNGIDIGDGGPITRKAHAERIDDTGRECTIELRIHEGRNRQVRRMIRALGHGVLALHRSHVGPLSLLGLEVGTSRALTDQEVASLRAAAVASARSTAP